MQKYYYPHNLALKLRITAKTYGHIYKCIYRGLYFHCLIDHVLCYVHFVTKVYYIES